MIYDVRKMSQVDNTHIARDTVICFMVEMADFERVVFE